ncbi:MAG: hypothetical protein AAB288_13775, partial [Acidobacteriota bacterium]
YKFNLLQPDDPYYPNWVERRRRRPIFLKCCLVWLPVTFLPMALILWAFATFDPFDPDSKRSTAVFLAAIFLPAIPTTLAILMASVYSGSWPCPRCGKPFWRASEEAIHPDEKCFYCGLPEYAPHDDSPDPHYEEKPHA